MFTLKPFFRSLSAMVAVLALSGCFTTELAAPPGKQVRILSQDEPVEYTDEYKNYYLLGGLLPIWTTQPAEIIAKEKLVEVRVRTRDTISDSVITLLSSLLPIMVFPQHVVIEGNREANMREKSAEGLPPPAKAVH